MTLPGAIILAALLIALAIQLSSPRRRRLPESTIAAKRAEIEASYPPAFAGQMPPEELQKLVDRRLQIWLDHGR